MKQVAYPTLLALSLLLGPLAIRPAKAASSSLVTAQTASGKTVKVNPFKCRAVITLATGGTIVFKFYPKEAPNTAANFIKLAEKGFYDGLTFHRVVPGFVVQGGDPKGDGSGGPGYTIPPEFNFHKHVPGAVGMARTADPNSAGSQFYICLGAAPWLDGQYTIFAHVVKGMDVAKKIQVGDVMKTVKIVP